MRQHFNLLLFFFHLVYQERTRKKKITRNYLLRFHFDAGTQTDTELGGSLTGSQLSNTILYQILLLLLCTYLLFYLDCFRCWLCCCNCSNDWSVPSYWQSLISNTNKANAKRSKKKKNFIRYFFAFGSTV